MAQTAFTRRRPQRRDASAVSINARSERLAALEAAVADIQRTLEIQFQRIATMQAELDHLRAKKANSDEAEHVQRAIDPEPEFPRRG